MLNCILSEHHELNEVGIPWKIMACNQLIKDGVIMHRHKIGGWMKASLIVACLTLESSALKSWCYAFTIVCQCEGHNNSTLLFVSKTRKSVSFSFETWKGRWLVHGHSAGHWQLQEYSPCYTLKSQSHHTMLPLSVLTPTLFPGPIQPCNTAQLPRKQASLSSPNGPPGSTEKL